MVFPLKPPFSYGFPMVFLWFSYGFPMVSQLFFDPDGPGSSHGGFVTGRLSASARQRAGDFGGDLKAKKTVVIDANLIGN